MMDETVLAFFNQTIAHPWLDILALALSLVGFALLPGLGVALLRGSQRRVGLTILVALATGFIAVMIFQFLGLRPRPEQVRLIRVTPNFPAYPSGHAAAAFSTAMVIMLSYRKPWVWATGVLFASLIALSRLYLGHHYPSDVLAGTVLGLAIGAASYGLLITEKGAAPRWHWLIWPQLAIAFLVSLMAYLDILPIHLLRWPLADKVFHFVLFGLIGFWLNLWLKGRAIQLKSWSIPLALIILFGVAIIEEGSQALSPLRSSSLADLASNFLGLTFFWWLSRQLLLRQQANYKSF